MGTWKDLTACFSWVSLKSQLCSVHSYTAMVSLSDSRRFSSLCSMYCASLTLAQTCNYCLCLTFVRETKPCPLDNLYTAAAFPSELPTTCLSCFVSLAVLRTTDPKSLSWLQVLPSSHAHCFHPDIPWAVEEKTSQAALVPGKLALHGMERAAGRDQCGRGCMTFPQLCCLS